MIDQEDEERQARIELDITLAFTQLYNLLRLSDRIKAEECLGFVAQAQALWLDES